MKLLVYKPDEAKLEEIAVDINLNPVFLTAIEMIDDEVFLGADGRHLFICQKNRSQYLVVCILKFEQIIYSRRHINGDVSVLFHSVKTERIPCCSLLHFRFAYAGSQLTRWACLTAVLASSFAVD